jgi:hypothetical protein
VFPVLSGPSEWEEKDGSDEDEDEDSNLPREQAVVHFAAAAFKRLSRAAPPGPVEESKGTHPEEDEESTESEVQTAGNNIETPSIDGDGAMSSPALTEQWLDDIQQGYGALYAPIFTALGVATVDQIHHLEDAQLTDIVRQLTEKTARRAIRAALLAHVRSPPAPEEDEGARAAQALAPTNEQSRPEQQEVPTMATTANSDDVAAISSPVVSAEQWLDGIQQGYGALYAPIFTALGANTVDEMRNLDKSQLKGIVQQMTANDDARRAIRAALRRHVRSRPVATENNEDTAPGEAAASAVEQAQPGGVPSTTRNSYHE